MPPLHGLDLRWPRSASMKHRRVLSAGEILGPSSEFVALQGDGVSKGYKGEPEPKS